MAMKADLAAKLGNAMRGEVTPKTSVTSVAGVPATCDKSLKLKLLLQLRAKNTTLENGEIRDVAGCVAILHEPDEAELEEPEGMAMDSVPEPYLDA
ncbi:MAG: hypothetical protein WBE80_08215 [Methylocella sp.]